MSSKKTICITSGDSDGIGLEVSLKALSKVGAKKDFRYFLYLADKKLGSSDARLLKLVSNKIKTEATNSFRQALESKSPLTLIQSKEAPAKWVEESAKACLSGEAHAICTAPLSKPGIQNAGLTDLGHTEILKRVCGVSSANMAFIGKKFSVVLTSDHLSVSEIPYRLTESLIEKSLKNCESLRKLLPAGVRSKPIGVLGLNPHAGDQGLIGDFEEKLLTPLILKLKSQGQKLAGPLVPDVAFQPHEWKKYSLYLSMYHDQGLIPFKLVHGFDSGVHLTLGLPICRTSVDHGTAKDIYGKNLANSGSMQEALQWALRLAGGPSHV